MWIFNVRGLVCALIIIYVKKISSDMQHEHYTLTKSLKVYPTHDHAPCINGCISQGKWEPHNCSTFASSAFLTLHSTRSPWTKTGRFFQPENWWEIPASLLLLNCNVGDILIFIREQTILKFLLMQLTKPSIVFMIFID